MAAPHRVDSLTDLESRLDLTDIERAGVLLAGHKLAMSITPHFFNLIDRDDPDCPIRRQVIPAHRGGLDAPEEMSDPCGEDTHMPVPGLVHRYPDRVLFLSPTAAPPTAATAPARASFPASASSIWKPSGRRPSATSKNHTEVRDVLLSGGDPLLFSDERLDKILTRLRAIPHIQFIRIGSRIPIFLPQRITPELCAMLKKHHPLFISIHTNHPRELTSEVRDALGRLADAGIPLGNQSVLLRGVNDSVEIQKGPRPQAADVPRPAVLSLSVRPHQRLVPPPHLRRGRRRNHRGPARPHHRLRHPPVRHRRPRRRRQNPDQSELPYRHRARQRHPAMPRWRNSTSRRFLHRIDKETTRPHRRTPRRRNLRVAESNGRTTSCRSPSVFGPGSRLLS
jgi:KamA family protein